MIIDKFLIQYKSTPDEKKTEFMKKHITTKYLPYENKVSLCKEILDRSMWIEVNGRQIFNMNSTTIYMLLIQAIIQEYTDIEMPDDGKERLDIFNTFEEYGITEHMINALEREYSALNTVLKMSSDDLIFNNTNLVAYIDQKLEAINLSTNAMMDGFSELLNKIEDKSETDNVVQFPTSEEDVDQV